MIHQPLGGVQGQATDIEIQAKEILRMRETSSTRSSRTTPASRSSRSSSDTDRDFFMSPEEAQEYGLWTR